MSSVLLLDVSRLIWRARRRGPTGIDRVELAYAGHFIQSQDTRPAYAVLHLMGFVFALSPRAGRRFIGELAARWEDAPATTSRNLKSILKVYGALLTSGWLIGPMLRRAVRGAAGEPPVFIVVSHHHLSRGHTIRRVRRTLGARTVCLIHDLIPLEYPEYFKPGWESRYRRIAGTIGRSFDAVIANSESTAQALRAALTPRGEDAPRLPAIRTAPLGVQSFRSRVGGQPARSGAPYFVVLGTIEPRKNHLLLLNLWRRLAESVTVPRLIVIGFRGWENEQVIDMLERSRALRGLVEERRHLNDAEVGELLHGAAALLLPSLAEGFGLPLGEALASGVPVICSDIPVFREVGRDVPEYLDPLDIRAWERAVLDYSETSSQRRAAQMRRLERWPAPSWREHFAAVEKLIDEVSAAEQPAPLGSEAAQPLPHNR